MTIFTLNIPFLPDIILAQMDIVDPHPAPEYLPRIPMNLALLFVSKTCKFIVEIKYLTIVRVIHVRLHKKRLVPIKLGKYEYVTSYNFRIETIKNNPTGILNWICDNLKQSKT